MIGITRGVFTLVGAAVAGFLIWLATQMGSDTAGSYWATYGLIAAAGLTMALSQLLGGWTKWGWPRLSAGVFVLGFLPVLIAGGWVLLARQPADFFNTSNWSRDLGINDVVGDLGELLAVIAFGIGLTFGFCFDTAGPREVVVDEPVDATTADQPLTAERREAVDEEERTRIERDRDSRAGRPRSRWLRVGRLRFRELPGGSTRKLSLPSGMKRGDGVPDSWTDGRRRLFPLQTGPFRPSARPLPGTRERHASDGARPARGDDRRRSHAEARLRAELPLAAGQRGRILRIRPTASAWASYALGPGRSSPRNRTKRKMAAAETSEMMSAVALETPTASMPSQRMTKNTTAQMNDWTP